MSPTVHAPICAECGEKWPCPVACIVLEVEGIAANEWLRECAAEPRPVPDGTRRQTPGRDDER